MHFSVMVVHNPKNSKESIIDDVKQILHPYHQYESTGERNEYVKEIDVTEKYLNNYNNDTVGVIFKNNELIGNMYDEQFKSCFTKENRTFIVPEGYTLKKDYPINKLYKSFREYIKEFCHIEDTGNFNYINSDDKIIKITNPNGKWDWYQIGGRWSGKLISKKQTVGIKIIGEKAWFNGDQTNGGFDSLLKRDIDIALMKEKATKEAIDLYQMKIDAGVENISWISWEDMSKGLGDTNIEIARKQYREQEAIKLINKFNSDTAINKGRCIWYIDELNTTLDDLIKFYTDNTLPTYALIYENNWYSKGDMNWWGVSTNENDNWEIEFTKLYDTIPNNYRITIVDCHS